MFCHNWQAKICRTVITALVALSLATGANAQGLIRDAEIERTMKSVTGPILRAAGLSPSQVDIYIIDNPRLNAFVAGGNNMFLHTGLMLKLETVDQLRAVVAHEAGHIAGGHLARRNDQIRASAGTTALGVLLAVAAAAASRNSEAAAAAGLIGSQVGQRSLLKHTRAEEGAADQAALRYMEAAGADPRAILEVMNIFRGQAFVSEATTDPYVRTHPLWSQRIRYLEDQVANTRRGTPTPQGEVYWHGRMVAKMEAFLRSPRSVLRKYGNSNSEQAALARAIAYHRQPNVRRARQAMDALLRARPKDPFYHELNGQFLLESGNAAAAVQAYRNAVALAPDEALILAGYGRALIALDTPAATREALNVLTKARRTEQADARALRDMAVAFARLGDNGRASLATAERYMLQGRIRDAGIHATRAARALPQGSPGWTQAQDILRAVKRASG